MQILIKYKTIDFVTLITVFPIWERLNGKITYFFLKNKQDYLTDYTTGITANLGKVTSK